jgi:hypothetical protein
VIHFGRFGEDIRRFGEAVGRFFHERHLVTLLAAKDERNKKTRLPLQMLFRFFPTPAKQCIAA